MIEYKCDRCGRIRQKKPSVDIFLPVKRKGYDDIRWIECCSGTGFRVSMDLCQTCMEEFKHFMEV